MLPLDKHIKAQLNDRIAQIGKCLGDVDMLSIVSPIMPSVDVRVRDAIELIRDSERKNGIAIILETPGGVVEIVEKIVEVIRSHYDEVTVIVPGKAMSAGTIFALSADRIMMDYFSRLGPIDPQVVRENKLVPALSYLKQYEKLNEKAEQGSITTVEYGMLQQLDIGELYQFEQARELSMELLQKWLSQYKFKDWQKTKGRGKTVTERMKKKRAQEIAKKLNDTERWHSHGRGISIDTLTSDELNLRIDDYSKDKRLAGSIKSYFDLLVDYLKRGNMVSFIHTERYF